MKRLAFLVSLNFISNYLVCSNILTPQEALKKKEEQNTVATKAEGDFLSMIHTYFLSDDDKSNLSEAIDTFNTSMQPNSNGLKKSVVAQNSNKLGFSLNLSGDAQKMFNAVTDSVVTIQNTGFVPKKGSWKKRTSLFLNNIKALLENITSQQSIDD